MSAPSIVMRAVIVLALVAAPGVRLRGQTPPRPLVELVREVRRSLARLSEVHADSVWPGFRPDTIPTLYVVRESGTLLAGWGKPLPPGYESLGDDGAFGWLPSASRAAASTGTSIDGRPVAQVVVTATDTAPLLGLSVHEAFHVFERVARREGRRFGDSENSFIVSTYPVFDSRNEREVALEGKLLAWALDAPSTTVLRARAQEFLAARERRHRRLAAPIAAFEDQAELNEGLAQYAQVRALQLMARDRTIPWRSAASGAAARDLAAVESLTSNVTQSIRLRFYATGPALGVLLDRLAGHAWKRDLVRDDVTLAEALALASGYRDRERRLSAAAEQRFDLPGLGRQATQRVGELRRLRRRQADSVADAPGVRLVITGDSLPGRSVSACFFDPQNLLQVDSTVLLHTRFVRPCSGRALDAELTTAAVQDRTAGTLVAVIGPRDGVRLTIEGQPVELSAGVRRSGARDVQVTSEVAKLRSALADVEFDGRVLTIRPRPS